MTKGLLNNTTIIAPMGTAIWLIDNTTLSFKQIGDFCDFTEAEVKLIADDVIGKGILPVDPTKNGNLTKEEIFAREQDGAPLNNTFKALDGLQISIQKKKKYIPMLLRRSRPETVLWLINYCPELSDAQIVKLVRTTKNMVQMIRNHTYEGYNDLVAKDPVILGFCLQKDVDKAIKIAKEKALKLSLKEQKGEKKRSTKKSSVAIRKINVNSVKVKKSKTSIKPAKKKVLKKHAVKPALTKKANKTKSSSKGNIAKKNVKKNVKSVKKNVKTTAKKVVKKQNIKK